MHTRMYGPAAVCKRCCGSTKKKDKGVKGAENLPEEVGLGQVTSLLSDSVPTPTKEKE